LLTALLSLMSDLIFLGASGGSTGFMLLVVSTSAVCAVLIALNLTSLKHRSTNRACVIAAVLLLLGVIIGVLGLGLGSMMEGSGRVLSGTPGRVSLGLVVASVVGALVGLVQLRGTSRQRRGRKRGLVTLIAAVVFMGVLGAAEYGARHPRSEAPSSQTQELELDPYRAVLGTPSTPPPTGRSTPAAPPSRPSPSGSRD
jgi:hypothetical protein